MNMNSAAESTARILGCEQPGCIKATLCSTVCVDRDHWRPMEEAPKNATWVLLRVPNGRQGFPSRRVVVAHFASDLSGSDQPPFHGWYFDDGYTFREVTPAPTGWLPIPPEALSAYLWR